MEWEQGLLQELLVMDYRNKYGPYDYRQFQIEQPKKRFRIPLITLFQKNSGGLSSKRVCGVLGWLVAMFCFVWCVIQGTTAPDFATELVIGCVSLLGVDSVSDAIGGFRRGGI